MSKNTTLLSDLPVEEDDFGPHSRIADQIVNIVQTPNLSAGPVPRSIALVGDWGSGKSSIIRMLRKRLYPDTSPVSKPTAEMFVYDAWAHEGDGLRRAFLDAMRGVFDPLFGDEQKENIRKGIWDKHETTTTTTQPVLRRHGKLLLLSLMLVPAGLRLFGSYPADLGANDKIAWNIACAIAFMAPLIAAIALYYVKEMAPLIVSKWLFGVSDQKELDELKISSVFFQRVEGSVDHKWVTNPADSIQQFRSAFADICEIVLGENGRIVIVVDNLDRLDKDEARAFWATMQSFFDRSGWGKNDAMDRVWLLVPFSMPAVSQIFKTEGSSSDAAAKAFIDKSFDLAFYVPPPIQVDSRNYLLRQIQAAFPEHEPRVHENVRNLYDHHRSGSSSIGRAGDASVSRRTPREMKLFVNQLVALYRSQGDDIPLEAMAAYLLTKDAIEKDGIDPAKQLSDYQRSLLLPDIDATQQLAAVHFGVSISDAAQVILSEPIRNALVTRNSQELETLAERSGFIDVLENVISTTGTNTVEDLLSKTLLIHNLSIGARPELHATWTRLIEEFRTVGELGIVSQSLVEGVTALRSRAYPSEASQLVNNIRRGLTTTWVSEASIGDGSETEEIAVYEGRLSQADSWVTLLSTVLPTNSDQLLSIPPFVGFSLRVIDAVSARSNSASLSKGVCAPSGPCKAFSCVFVRPLARRDNWPNGPSGILQSAGRSDESQGQLDERGCRLR